MNNNQLKRELVIFAMDAGNLVSVSECKHKNMNDSDFVLTFISNGAVYHELTFNYHLKLLDYKLSGDVNRLTKFDRIESIIEKAKEIRKTIGYGAMA